MGKTLLGAGAVVLAGVACIALACSEGGTIAPAESGAGDAEGAHDVVFVPQQDNDGDVVEPPWDAEEEGDALAESDAPALLDAGGDGDAIVPPAEGGADAGGDAGADAADGALAESG